MSTPIRRTAASVASLLFLSVVAVSAETAPAVHITYAATDQEATVVLAALSELSGVHQELEVELLVSGLGNDKPVFHLEDAAPAGQRQALAHALGCWWEEKPDHGMLFTRQPHLSQGRLEVRNFPSALRGNPSLEGLARQLMVPWLGGDAGLSLHAEDGAWTATLDSSGHAHLLEVLDLLERAQPRCLQIFTDPDLPDLDLPSPAVHATTWHSLAEQLGRAAHLSVSIGFGLLTVPPPAGGISIPATRLGDLPRRLSVVGIEAGFLHGVLCLDDRMIEEREHPGQCRRLALLPIPHLATTPIEGECIATALRRHVRPERWQLPGAGIHYLEPSHALLVAADPATQAAVLEALDLIDRLGVETGLATLAADAPGGR
jgi:hypothetical protein